MNNRIAIDPNICHGQACVKGTRIPVSQIVGMIANGDTIEEILACFPLTESCGQDPVEKYAAILAEEQITPVEI